MGKDLPVHLSLKPTAKAKTDKVDHTADSLTARPVPAQAPLKGHKHSSPKRGHLKSNRAVKSTAPKKHKTRVLKFRPIEIIYKDGSRKKIPHIGLVNGSTANVL